MSDVTRPATDTQFVPEDIRKDPWWQTFRVQNDAAFETAERERDEALAREAALREAIVVPAISADWHCRLCDSYSTPEPQHRTSCILAQPSPATGKVLISREDLDFLFGLLPEWTREVPDGLDPTFYGTLSAEGDRAIKARLDALRAGEEGARSLTDAEEAEIIRNRHGEWLDEHD